MGVLSGIRVLDFGRYIAGPWCAALLGDFGAEVIRVEKIAGSEDRAMMPVGEGDGPDAGGAMFQQMNRGKKGITLNPRTPEGREVLRRLVQTADVVVANLPPQGLVVTGLDHASLSAIKPDIILTTVSVFGHGGPYSERIGFDGLGYSMSGAAHLTGPPDMPMRDSVPVVDFGSAMMSAFGTLAALMHRERTGEGQMVEGALLRTALTYAGPFLIEQAMTGRDRVGTLNRSQTAGPGDILPTGDGWIIVSVVGDQIFRRWARMVGRPDLLEDPRFATDIDRGDNGEALSEIARAHVAGMTTAEALAIHAEASVPAGPVLTPQQALDDPHVAAMGFLEDVSQPGRPPAPVAGAPIRLSRSPGRIHGPAPRLGEHTDEVLESLGYDAAAIAALRDAGAV